MTSKATKNGSRSKGRPESGDAVGREALIAATIEALREMPPERITLADIASRAHAHPALIRYYFGSKEGLILASVMSQVEALQKADSPEEIRDGAIRDRLVARARRIISTERGNPHFYQLLMEWADQAEHPDSYDLMRKVADRGLLRTVSMLHASSEPPVRAVDPRLVHIALVGACVFFVNGRPLIEHLFGQGSYNEDLSDRYIDFLTDTLLRGLLSRPA